MSFLAKLQNTESAPLDRELQLSDVFYLRIGAIGVVGDDENAEVYEQIGQKVVDFINPHYDPKGNNMVITSVEGQQLSKEEVYEYLQALLSSSPEGE